MDTSLVLIGICCIPAILCAVPASNITNSTNDIVGILEDRVCHKKKRVRLGTPERSDSLKLVNHQTNKDLSKRLVDVTGDERAGSFLAQRKKAQGKNNQNVKTACVFVYVIHATVYQVGIITNKSDDEIANMTGNQEALSFYHSNGSNVDLSAIPAPLITNVTANSAVAVAPVQLSSSPDNNPAISVLDQLALGSKPAIVKRSEDSAQSRSEKNLDAAYRSDMGRSVYMNHFKRSTDNSSAGPTIKVVKETSLIPPEVGLKSIGLPDLVGLNTSLASVPVPIPNTSVVRYAKINTVVKAT